MPAAIATRILRDAHAGARPQLSSGVRQHTDIVVTEQPPTCHRALRRFWFPLPRDFGIGVTAASEAEARALAEEARVRYFPDQALGAVVPDIDLATLDAKHMLNNAGPVVVRGVWYPRLNI